MKDLINSYKLYIVDYDGTIIDSMSMWRHMYSDYVFDMGYGRDYELDKISIKQTNAETAEHYRLNFEPDKPLNDCIMEMDEYVLKKYLNQKLKPGAYEFLKEIKKHGRVVLFSATSLSLLEASLDVLGIKDLFDDIYSASKMNVTKADGTGYLEVMRREGFSKSDCLIVEDAPHAIEGAKSKKLNILAVTDVSNERHIDEVKRNSKYFVNLEEVYK